MDPGRPKTAEKGGDQRPPRSETRDREDTADSSVLPRVGSGRPRDLLGDEEGTPSSVRPDDVLGGKYRLERVLAEGGMGTLWVAHDEVLHVPVALKLIRADLQGATGDLMAERLLIEARAAARLGHPAIARTLDFGTTERGAAYLVMELLDGEDLYSALERRGRVSPKKAVKILLPIAHGLAAAHDKNIVHRDIKPENIFLAVVEGQVQPKLIDFGVARLAERGIDRLTAAGVMMGSPGYMSPEQARGDDADHRADIWSLCVLLYEMVTGRLPFEGKNVQALLRSIIEDTVPPISNFNAGDEELWEILEAGLRRDPEARWKSMRHLGRALARWALARGIHDDICGASLETMWLRDPDRSSQDPLESVMPPPMTPMRPRSPSFPSLGDASGIPPVSCTRAADGTGRVEAVRSQSLGGTEAPSSGRFTAILVAMTVTVVLLGGLAVWRITAPMAAAGPRLQIPATGALRAKVQELAGEPRRPAPPAATPVATPEPTGGTTASATAEAPPATGGPAKPVVPTRPTLKRPTF